MELEDAGSKCSMTLRAKYSPKRTAMDLVKHRTCSAASSKTPQETTLDVLVVEVPVTEVGRSWTGARTGRRSDLGILTAVDMVVDRVEACGGESGESGESGDD